MTEAPLRSAGQPHRGFLRWPVSPSWWKANERSILIASILLQCLVLLGMTVLPMSTLMTGQVIRLRVEPVDPRDLFRGDYVILSYAFSRLPPQAFNRQDRDAVDGQDVFVILEPLAGGKEWVAADFVWDMPSGKTFIKGRVRNYGRVEFGIESFFVQEGRGREYEQAIQSKQLFAEVSLDSAGQAVLRNLVIEP